ncbi:amidohydrolase [Paramagnetospirillum kuznetsovii]|uniref:Amidohydrolase n=1 Tax=Paramagnetospirillum kuznetsovii TaxID=2053833 RepID=A0A364NVC5_9PROT|nr:amidohydrolase family protein [Paramagnetospirillum kuznetsovii]RAU21039.1 amidohydrolase [Paramagnetospirillum kuznetsovii]
MRIDAHAHAFDASVVLAQDRRYQPDYEAPAEAWLAQLDAHGIHCGVLVQPSFLATDNSYLLGVLARYPERLRGVAVAELTATAEELADLKARGVRAMRLNLIGRSHRGLKDIGGRRFLSQCMELGLAVEVQAEGDAWLEILPSLLVSGAPIVIDHLGRPTSPRCPGFGAILDAAALPRVWVKVSAPYRSPPTVAGACLALLAKRAGTERLIWGSDWPWTQHEAGRSMSEAMRWITPHLPASALPSVTGGNAARLFGF